jgi:hypothetical protein
MRVESSATAIHWTVQNWSLLLGSEIRARSGVV